MTAFIGDVHGCARQLIELLDVVVPQASQIVMLGDYVNRGPDTKKVFSILADLQDSMGDDLKLIRGNHDHLFRQVLVDPSVEADFLRHGGAATIRSYVQPPYENVFRQLREAVPPRHISVLESLVDDWTDGTVYAKHRLDPGSAGPSNMFTVAGHSVQKSTVPFINDKIALLDTGCGTTPNGQLTAFFWPSKKWIQTGAPS